MRLLMIQIMSKSVRSHKSTTSRRTQLNKQAQNAQIKQKIKQILYTVKEERQHIENLVHQNEVQIEQLRSQYQVVQKQNDFQHLSGEQQLILNQLAQGLKEMSIDPVQILGQNQHLKEQEMPKQRQLSKQEIIKVQQILIARLKHQLIEK